MDMGWDRLSGTGVMVDMKGKSGGRLNFTTAPGGEFAPGRKLRHGLHHLHLPTLQPANLLFCSTVII